jgi:hypothetical protein
MANIAEQFAEIVVTSMSAFEQSFPQHVRPGWVDSSLPDVRVLRGES